MLRPLFFFIYLLSTKSFLLVRHDYRLNCLQSSKRPNYKREPPRSNFIEDDPESASSTSRKSRSSDPWKVLITKLDSTKGDSTHFGKNLIASKGDNVPDQLLCRHFGTCSGCTIRGNFTESPVIKQARVYFASESISLRVHVGDHHGWRTHVKLAVQPLSRWGGLKIGLYKAGSHEVEPISHCRVHHPRINEAVEEFRAAASDVGVKAYQPPLSTAGGKNIDSSGELRYLQMSVERNTSKIQLTMVWNAMMYKDAEQTLPRLVKRLKSRPDLWHSISINFQTSTSNAILNYQPKAWKLLWGPPTVKEKVGAANFFFKPQVFRQANLDLFASSIIPMVVSHIPKDAKVAELYSGIGIIGLNIAEKASEVLCSDSNEYVDEIFNDCADSLPEMSQQKVFFENLSAEEAVEKGQCNDAEVLIVDPPRRGLDRGVLDLLVNKHANVKAESLKRLVYISCGFEALESDCRVLLSSGLWKLKAADGYVMFPGSDHIETVAVFDRKN